MRLSFATACLVAFSLLPVLAGAAEAPATQPVQATVPAEPEGMVKIFNGKDLEGWDGDMRLWSAKEGVIRGETTKENPTSGNTFLIWKGGEIADFELRLSFRIDHGNSGIQYRSKHVTPKETDKNKWVVGGYQAEVENTPGKVGFLYHERGSNRGYGGKGSFLCKVGDRVEIDETGNVKSVGTLGDAKAIAATYKKSGWNDYVIIARGNHIQHYLNGLAVVDVTDNDPKGRMMSGILALQIHAGPPMVVEFKDLRLKKFEAGK